MKDIVLRPLSSPAPPELLSMTFPAYRHMLTLEQVSRHPEQGDLRRVQPFAVAAWRGFEAVGLLVGEMPLDGAAREAAADVRLAYGGRPEILSVFVNPAYRRRGVATSLVGAGEAEVRRRGGREIGVIYTTGKPGVGYVERIFARRGWSEPKPRTLSVRVPLQALLDNPPLSSAAMAELARPLEIFPWSELRDEERDELRRSQTTAPWIEPGLVPWRFEHHLHPSSRGVRYEGQVVGWVLNQTVSDEVVRLTCAYMRKDLSRWAMLAPVFYASLEELRGTSCRSCTFITPFCYHEMIRSIRRYWVPLASAVHETRGAWKNVDVP